MKVDLCAKFADGTGVELIADNIVDGLRLMAIACGVSPPAPLQEPVTRDSDTQPKTGDAQQGSARE